MNYQKYRKQKPHKKRKQVVSSRLRKKSQPSLADLANIFFPEATLMHLYEKVH